MAGVLRGEIWWARLDPVEGHEQGGRRPVLIISHDVLNDRSGTVIGLAITSREPRVGSPLAHEITSCDMPKVSWVKTNQVRTLDTGRLGDRIGRVSDEELADVLD